MSGSRIFLSHSSRDNQFCFPLVSGLEKAGADVWIDQKELHTGPLLSVITNELVARPIFVVVLSRAAFASSWVTQECQWAFNCYKRKPTERVILPITAETFDPNDFDAWLFMEEFKRIEGPGGAPLPISEAVTQTLHALDLDADSRTHASPISQAARSKAVLWVDDTPSNNYYERHYLERRGFEVTISLSTDDALGKLIRYEYAAVISDMGRPEDPMAGYTLLEWMQKLGKPTPPLVLYTSSRRPDHVMEAKRRGAFGQTNAPNELVHLLTQVLSIS